MSIMNLCSADAPPRIHPPEKQRCAVFPAFCAGKRRRGVLASGSLEVMPASVRGPCPLTILTLPAHLAIQRKLLRQCARIGRWASASDTVAESCQGTILLPSATFVCSLEGEGRRSSPYTEDVAHRRSARPGLPPSQGWYGRRVQNGLDRIWHWRPARCGRGAA
jgi:hypothetical protein